jgi:CO/xanthine dehydrogenase FAD-binding subunit
VTTITEVLTPTDRLGLTRMLQRLTADSRFLAGGTDLVRSMANEHLRPDLILDLSAVRELAGVRLEDGALRVGATATFARLEADQLVRQHARCLYDAASLVGSRQIRNVATVGGNVANASPCGDSIPALLALGAEAEIWDGDGRTVRKPIQDVLAGPGRTTLRSDQMIAAFVCQTLGDGARAAFVKIGCRSTVAVARLSMAVIVDYDPDAGLLSGARVALGAVGSMAFRDELVEAALNNRPAEARTAQRFAEGCIEAVCRSIPGRYSLPYKRLAARALAYDAWNALQVCPSCEPACWD